MCTFPADRPGHVYIGMLKEWVCVSWSVRGFKMLTSAQYFRAIYAENPKFIACEKSVTVNVVTIFELRLLQI